MRGVRATGVRVRKAHLSDAAAIARVMRAAIRLLAAGFYSPTEIAAWSSLPALYHVWAMTAGGEEYVVAEREGRIAGYAALHGAQLTALFVQPGLARRGIGGALLARVEREARRRGARALRTSAALSGAEFYRARGFTGARRVRVPLPGGGALASMALRKSLPGRLIRRALRRPASP